MRGDLEKWFNSNYWQGHQGSGRRWDKPQTTLTDCSEGLKETTLSQQQTVSEDRRNVLTMFSTFGAVKETFEMT